MTMTTTKCLQNAIFRVFSLSLCPYILPVKALKIFNKSTKDSSIFIVLLHVLQNMNFTIFHVLTTYLQKITTFLLLAWIYFLRILAIISYGKRLETMINARGTHVKHTFLHILNKLAIYIKCSFTVRCHNPKLTYGLSNQKERAAWRM